MKFSWDEAKRRANLRKHGIDFVGCDTIFLGHTLTIEDDRFGYSEPRYFTLGLLEGRCVAVAHTETDDEIRIISIRKADHGEQEIYFSSAPYSQEPD